MNLATLQDIRDELAALEAEGKRGKRRGSKRRNRRARAYIDRQLSRNQRRH